MQTAGRKFLGLGKILILTYRWQPQPASSTALCDAREMAPDLTAKGEKKKKKSQRGMPALVEPLKSLDESSPGVGDYLDACFGSTDR